VETETLKDLTPDELRYVLGNVLRSSRYGAISSRIGRVKNFLTGLAFSDCELVSNLELTQAVYDRMRGDGDDLPFPAQVEDVLEAVKGAADELSGRVVGSVTWMTAEEVDGLVDELIDLYSDEEKAVAMLKRIAY
jgi:CRISPR-associated protein Csc2